MQFDQLKRREFITLLGSGAVAWPFAARAQQPAMPVIGFLSSRSSHESTHLLAGFGRGLAENGYVDGQNVTIEHRWAEGQYDQLPALAAELVGRAVSVIVAVGGDQTAMAAKAKTSTIPIVFTLGSDPIKLGLVASYNRPGGNVSGISTLVNILEPKRLGLLHELVPQATVIGILFNPDNPPAEQQLRSLEEAARDLALQLRVLHASTDGAIETAFKSIAQNRISALAVAADPFFNSRRDKIVALAARQAIPAMYPFREYPVAGGLMSYGIDLPDAYRQAGLYAGRILKGAKPADLPVVQPSKFEFVVNLKTAKALGLKLSDNLMSVADEVIE
jgi:putative tryptophan/tyrosine transport system substrate-binding protein